MIDRCLRKLNLSSTCSIVDIKKSYRKLAQKYHPDKYNGSSDKFIEIKNAYDYLILHFDDIQKTSIISNTRNSILVKDIRIDIKNSFYVESILIDELEVYFKLQASVYHNQIISIQLKNKYNKLYDCTFKIILYDSSRFYSISKIDGIDYLTCNVYPSVSQCLAKSCISIKNANPIRPRIEIKLDIKQIENIKEIQAAGLLTKNGTRDKLMVFIHYKNKQLSDEDFYVLQDLRSAIDEAMKICKNTIQNEKMYANNR